MILLFFLMAVGDQYLMMQPIQDSIQSGDFIQMQEISENKISIHLESPFQLKGYGYGEKFFKDFSVKFSAYKTHNIEWVSKQVEENYAVQSLNVMLINKRSQQILYYKFIFFMKKNMHKDKEWKVYYLKGLKI